MPFMELLWLVCLGIFAILGVAAIPANYLGNRNLIRRLSIAGFLLFGVLLMAQAIQILVSPDHAGAVTSADATKTGVFLIFGGLVMIGFALLAAVGRIGSQTD